MLPDVYAGQTSAAEDEANERPSGIYVVTVVLVGHGGTDSIPP